MSQKIAINRRRTHQKGYIAIMIALTLVLMTTLALNVNDFTTTTRITLNQTQQQWDRLQYAKQSLLAFAALTETTYATDASGDLTTNPKIPGPGYLPCPDTNGDGAQEVECGGSPTTPYITGTLPTKNSTRSFTYDPLTASSPEKIQYTVSDYFVYQSNRHNTSNNPSIYTPLNTNTVNGFTDLLSINGQAKYIAVLVLPGKDGTIDPANNGSSGTFTTSDNDDIIIGISRKEWKQAVEPVVCYFKNHPPSTQPDWYSTNGAPVGSNWSNLITNGSITCP